jgi:hypothetical protein
MCILAYTWATVSEIRYFTVFICFQIICGIVLIWNSVLSTYLHIRFHLWAILFKETNKRQRVVSGKMQGLFVDLKPTDISSVYSLCTILHPKSGLLPLLQIIWHIFTKFVYLLYRITSQIKAVSHPKVIKGILHMSNNIWL